MRKCFSCGGHGSLTHESVLDNWCGVAGSWNVVSCGVCGVSWLDPFPSDTEIASFYRGDYYTHNQQPDSTDVRRFREELRLGLLSLIPGYARLCSSPGMRAGAKALSILPGVRDAAALGLMLLGDRPKGRLLDVGCGSGRFLQVMQKAGWDVLGVDPDEAAVERARVVFGVPAISGDLLQLELPADSFDAVTLSHVIEHALHPIDLLKACHRLLKPRGCLALSTPNAAAWGHRLFGRHWNQLDVPRHLHLFSSEGVARVLAESGFVQIVVRSTAKSASAVFGASLRRTLAGYGPRWSIQVVASTMGVVFHAAEQGALGYFPKAGEELFASGERA
jgi:2-polyprenyl-3-methyl-5-hydroxy-6-metoxy-1,4-benzoquinol methylase